MRVHSSNTSKFLSNSVLQIRLDRLHVEGEGHLVLVVAHSVVVSILHLSTLHSHPLLMLKRSKNNNKKLKGEKKEERWMEVARKNKCNT